METNNLLNPRTRKKVLMFGWNMPSPAYMRDNMRVIERHTYDGVCIKLPAKAGGGEIFDVKQWRAVSQAARDTEMQVLSAIPKSKKVTDNFVVLYGASTMNWFDDSDWETVLDQTRYTARGARAAGCKGVCWDAEPYHDINPWRFVSLPSREAHNFEEHVAIVQKRGAQFMQALQDEFPGLTVFALRLLSDYGDGSPFAQAVLSVHDTQAQQINWKNAGGACTTRLSMACQRRRAGCRNRGRQRRSLLLHIGDRVLPNPTHAPAGCTDAGAAGAADPLSRALSHRPRRLRKLSHRRMGRIAQEFPGLPDTHGA